MSPVPSSSRRRNRTRLLFVAIAALTILASHLVPGAGPAAASADDEAAFVAALNEVRADNGLPPFTVNAELATLAREHAQVMADQGEIFHANPISEGFTGAWAKLGENVGVGAGVDVLVDAFVASPGHFANIVDPSFSEIGVGVVWDGSSLYTTHRFLQLPGPSTPPTTAPPTTAETPTTTAPTTTAPATSTSTTAPVDPTADTGDGEPEFAPLPAPPITAERVLALLALLDRVGT